MKKYVFIFSLLIFHFSVCLAQDTLVYATGEKVAVNVLSVIGDDVNYTIPASKIQKTVKFWNFNYIKYEDGTIYSYGEFKAKQDSIAHQLKVKQDSLYEVNNPDYRPININVGFGGSYMEEQIPGRPSIIAATIGGYPTIKFLTDSPVYGFIIDYNILRRLSIGLGGAYEYVTDNPVNQQNNLVYTWETEKIIRTNISGRIVYHCKKTKLIDAYFGCRIGQSVWTDQIISNTATNPYFTPSITTMNASTEQTTSFQVLFGFRIFPIYNLGVHYEIGIGAPYQVEGGLTFRFKTKKDK